MKKTVFGALLGMGLGIVGTLVVQQIMALSVSVPEGLAQEYGDKGWQRVSARGDAAIWVTLGDPYSYTLTKGQDLIAVIPTDNENHWLEVYDGNKIAVNVNWALRRIWDRSKLEWQFTTDPTESGRNGD